MPRSLLVGACVAVALLAGCTGSPVRDAEPDAAAPGGGPDAPEAGGGDAPGAVDPFVAPGVPSPVVNDSTPESDFPGPEPPPAPVPPRTPVDVVTPFAPEAPGDEALAA